MEPRTWGGILFSHMAYGEQHLDFGQQADYLLGKGLVADRDELVQRLRNIGYHRLYAYAHPYLQRSPEGEPTEEFQDGSTLEKIWRHYQFDRNLRRHFLDAVERIEVALRCMLSYYHTENHTPYDYASADYFPQWKGYLQKLEHLAAQKKAGDAYAKTGAESADSLIVPCGGQHEYLPIWLALSISDFGFLCYFYRYSDKSIRQKIAQSWGLSVKVLSSWLPALRDLRNDCAHHARVWNKGYTRYIPSLPAYSEDKQWYYTYSDRLGKWVKPDANAGELQPFVVESSAGCFLFICRRWMRAVAPTSHWHERVTEFLLNAEAQGITLRKTGLPPHWETHPLWK